MQKKLTYVIFVIFLLIYSYLIFIGNNRFIYNIGYKEIFIFFGLVFLFLVIMNLIIKDKELYKNSIKMCIIMYFILLISLVFFIGRTNIRLYNWSYGGQHQLGKTIISQIKYGSTYSILKNIIGNLVMFMPLSFLLIIDNKKNKSIIRQTILILPLIIIVEVLQAYTHTGIFDVDDIFLNYVGTIMFSMIYILIERMIKHA